MTRSATPAKPTKGSAKALYSTKKTRNRGKVPYTGPIEKHPRLATAIKGVLNGKMDQEIAEKLKPPVPISAIATIRNHILPECLPAAANIATDGVSLGQVIANIAETKYIQRRIMTREAMTHELMVNAVGTHNVADYCRLSEVSNECLSLLGKVERILIDGGANGPATPPMNFNFMPAPPPNYEKDTVKVEVSKGAVIDITEDSNAKIASGSEMRGGQSPWEGMPANANEVRSGSDDQSEGDGSVEAPALQQE